MLHVSGEYMEAEDKPKRQKRVYACIFALCLLYFVSMYSAINYERYGTVAELSLSSLASLFTAYCGLFSDCMAACEIFA